FSEKLDDTSTRDTTGNFMVHMNVVSTGQIKKEELQSKGIKSPSKLLSPKYLSQASLEEQNRNPSSPKCVHFINFVIILHKEDEVREEENVKPNATKVSIDRIPPFVIGDDDDGNEKTHYSDSLILGPEYKYDESVCKAI
ncbi:hypothetical protein Tco_1323460, partial [Tanacetum coccineum]